MKFRRRNYIINKKMQLKYSVLFMLASLIGSALAVLLFNILAVSRLESIMWSSHLNVQSTGEIIKPLALYVNTAGVIFVFVLLMLTGIWMMKKTSGPLFRISKDIGQASEGDLSTVVILRRKDEFKEVADDLNTMMEHLRNEFTGIITSYQDVSKSLENFIDASEKGGDISEVLAELESRIKNIEKQISRFKLK